MIIFKRSFFARPIYGLGFRMLIKNIVPLWGLVYDIEKDVPPWGLVNDIKVDDPPGPPYTHRCRLGVWYMMLKGSAAIVPFCRRGDWYKILKRMCCLQALPTPSSASVGIGI